MKQNTLLKHLPLVVGILLPLVFVGVAVGMSVASTSKIQPAHDFIYVTDQSPYATFASEYRVESDRVVLVSTPVVEGREGTRRGAPTLYRYNVKENTTTALSEADARALSVTPGPSSPDGYIVEHRYGGSFGIFGGGDESGFYVSKEGVGKRLPALTNERSAYGFAVIGWIR